MIEPGIHTMTADTYHSDPCPEPSLSASVAKTLLTDSPLHAKFAHPRLSPAFEREEKEIFDLGTAAHVYLLEGGSDAFAILDFPDWRTKVAKEARAAARLEGKVPLLAEKWDAVQAMAEVARHQLASFAERPRPLTSGMAEQTLVWQEENGIWCRARLDWLHDDHRTIDDYKSTGASAHPDVWTRGPIFNLGFDLQAAFYLRGLKVLFDIDAAFRFVVQENYPPYALSVIGLGPDAAVLAEKKRRMAVRLWGECLASNQWPAYPPRICYADLPPWLEAQWLEKELRDEDRRTRPTQTAFVDDGRPIDEQLAGMGDIR